VSSQQAADENLLWDQPGYKAEEVSNLPSAKEEKQPEPTRKDHTPARHAAITQSTRDRPPGPAPFFQKNNDETARARRIAELKQGLELVDGRMSDEPDVTVEKSNVLIVYVHDQMIS
jgi:hypothetical protein